MDFTVFPVASTTMFPVANSHAGGQILSEYNQRIRETVAYHSNIRYDCSPSYTHSIRDFQISKQSASVLKISGGSALVHGHFVHLDGDITIDMSTSGLSGHLVVGLRAMYNNPTTAAASIQIENGSGYYEGIKVVILPSAQFKLPENDGSGNPTSQDQVTAHLKLGEFDYSAGTISSVIPDDTRIQCLDAERISNVDELLRQGYVSRDMLDPNKFYIMAGKGSQDPTDKDYWTDYTGSAVVWESNPTLTSGADTTKVKKLWLKNQNTTGRELLEQAEFRYDDEDDQLKLVLPHKDLPWTTGANKLYYTPVEVALPAANRATGAGGVLDSRWVNFINGLDNKIETMYRMPGGKMRKFIEVLTSREDLPKIPINYDSDQTRTAAYYDTRIQYSFNLLQSQLAQLNAKFVDFQSKLESDWTAAVTNNVTTTMNESQTSMLNKIDSLSSDVASFAGDLAALTGDVTASSKYLITNYESYYKALIQRTNDLASDITELQNRWMSATGSGGDTPTEEELNKKLSELSAKIENDITTAISSVTASVIEASAKAGQVEVAIASLKQSLYGNGTSANAGDINNLSTSIELLRKQYDYLYDAIHDLYQGITAEVEKATTGLYSSLLSELSKNMDEMMSELAEKYNINAKWSPGDYVLVAQDQTVTSSSDLVTFPSTMYVVVPGRTLLDSENVASYYDVYTTDLSVPISRVNGTSSTSTKDVFSNTIDSYNTAVDTIMRKVPAKFIYGYELGSNGVTELSSAEELPDVYSSNAMLEALYNSSVMLEGVRGTPGRDYFVLRYKYPVGTPVTGYYTNQVTGEVFNEDEIQYQVYRWVSVFFTLQLTSDELELDKDNPILLTGGTPYAEEDRVGGFLNVPSDAYGGGYVSRDDAGHLRLNDFELLAAGVSAYQLGEDRTEGAGLNLEELQDVFDQYINQRIAFPNANQLYKASEKGLRTDIITIELNIGSTSEGTLNIYDLDSRFNTAVNLKISGSSTENVVINISNCARLKITLDETSHPTIFIKNVCLYYDPDVIDRIASIEDMSLWYTRFEDTDPKLEVDGMTVICQEKLEPKGTNEFWTHASGNDNSYAYALRQLTFASDGTIIGMGVAVTDNTTNNIMPTGESIFAATFTLPQSIGLAYPVTRLKKQIKVTGNFITAFYTKVSGTTNGFSVKNTNFTILTQKYLTYADVRESIQGTISFYTRTSVIQDTGGADSGTLLALNNDYAVNGWDSGAYHIFYGGAIE